MKIAKPLILVLLLLFGSCNGKTKFDREKWLERDDFDFPFRAMMIDDLQSRYNFIGYHYSDVQKLLGHPQNWGGDFFSYQITIHYNGIDSDSGNFLHFNYNKDSIITSYKVLDLKHDE